MHQPTQGGGHGGLSHHPTGAIVVQSSSSTPAQAQFVIQSPIQIVQATSSPSASSNLIHSGIKRSFDFSEIRSVGGRGAEFINGNFLDTKRKKEEKGGKGLRHFSMKVCEKVRTKGTTSYNEVADELVTEFAQDQHNAAINGDQVYDQKNIRRRVYDALNVLMAMNIISKEKKEIKWIGLPTNSAQEYQRLEMEKRNRIDRIAQKTRELHDLILYQIAYKNLVNRNKKVEQRSGPPGQSSAIPLPFVIVNTGKKTVIDCSISSDKTEYLFQFDNVFEINEDKDVLNMMGMAFGLEKSGHCTQGNLQQAMKLVPKALEPYVLDIFNGVGRNAEATTSGIVGNSTNCHVSVGGEQITSAGTSGMDLLHAAVAVAGGSSSANSNRIGPTNSRATPSYSDEDDDDEDEELYEDKQY